MSIILEGIDLPTDRKPYGIEVIYRFEGADGLFSEKNYLSPNQAIQISKKHGRLIDEREVKKAQFIINDQWGSYPVISLGNLHCVPTILEAEE